jgi:hypothetical protein
MQSCQQSMFRSTAIAACLASTLYCRLDKLFDEFDIKPIAISSLLTLCTPKEDAVMMVIRCACIWRPRRARYEGAVSVCMRLPVTAREQNHLIIMAATIAISRPGFLGAMFGRQTLDIAFLYWFGGTGSRSVACFARRIGRKMITYSPRSLYLPAKNFRNI